MFCVTWPCVCVSGSLINIAYVMLQGTHVDIYAWYTDVIQEKKSYLSAVILYDQ